MKEYEYIYNLASQLGYKEFTKLQKKAFENVDTYDYEKWIIAIGATSSGKTLIAVLIYLYKYTLYRKNGKSYRMIFAVPYRALAAQKNSEIGEMLQKMDVDLKVIQSTGEFRNDDIAILNGKVDIAVIIYEKIFMFASMNSNFLSYYDILVMDEIGLTQNLVRGVKVDFILARAKMVSSLRVIALATPFYNWKNYIEKYQFIQIKEDERPIELKVFPIYYGKNGVNHVEPMCQAVNEGLFPPTNNEAFEINPWRRVDNIIKDICVYHLKRGNKIIIFENNRREVRLLSQRLYKCLEKEGVLTSWITEKDCKRYIQEQIGIDIKEELYGIMGEEDYQAFASGISYHNADIPVSLRTLVEKEFLKTNGNLKIVCSTETLVYGINSNTDVVIIPNMIKQRSEECLYNGFLYPNEYMNYAGRAGRLNSSLSIQREEQVGYIYPFLNANYYKLDEERNKSDQKLQWEKLQMEILMPKQVISHYFLLDTKMRIFYLLSLFPNGKEEMLSDEITQSEIINILKNIPCDPNIAFNEQLDIPNSLIELEKRKLIYIANDCDDEDEDFVPKYRLTDAGRNLTGYIIDLDDYDFLMKSVCQCITANKIYSLDLLYKIIKIKRIKQNINNIVGVLSDFYPQAIKETVDAIKSLFEHKSGQASREFCARIKKDIIKYKSLIKKNEYKKIANDPYFINYRLLFAMVMWTDEKCTIALLYNNFSISYMQMVRFTEIVSYYLDIISLALPVAFVDSQCTLYSKLGSSRIREAEEEIRGLSEELFYRVPASICRFLGIHCYDPYKALKLREIGKIYNQLDIYLDKECELTQKEKKQLKDIEKKIEKWEPDWQEAFYKKFGGIMNNGNN